MTNTELSLIEQARAEELKKHAVEFGQWASANEYWFVNGMWYLKPCSDEEQKFTDDELYNLFNPSKP